MAAAAVTRGLLAFLVSTLVVACGSGSTGFGSSDGGLMVPDGSTIVRGPDGSTIVRAPDGATFTEGPDGSLTPIPGKDASTDGTVAPGKDGAAPPGTDSATTVPFDAAPPPPVTACDLCVAAGGTCTGGVCTLSENPGNVAARPTPRSSGSTRTTRPSFRAASCRPRSSSAGRHPRQFGFTSRSPR